MPDRTPPGSPAPRGAAPATLLAAGRYAVLLTAGGGGCSLFDGHALTRWSADRTRDAEGFHLYLRDADTGETWSAGFQPVGRPAEAYAARLGEGRAEIVRTDGTMETRTEVRVAAEGDAELRRVTLVNRGPRARRVEVTTCAELVLNTPAGDAGHPAFAKLFVQTAWDAERAALLAWRRLRSPDDAPLWVTHRLLGGGAPERETDRARFLGRGRTLAAPAALADGAPLSGTTGNVLDPLFALRRTVEVAPGESVRLVAVLGAGRTREDVDALAARWPDAAAADALFAYAAETRPVSDGEAYGLPAAWLGEVGRLPMPPLAGEAADAFRAASPNDAEADGDAAAGDDLGAGDDPQREGETLRFFNGHGGFSADGREYVVRLGGGPGGPARPPLPWTNVVANDAAGFLVSESGAASTWAGNSRENRLTPWSNDPVADPHGEALYLRDEDAGVFWSPTPGPVPGAGRYETRHGFGYTRFRHAGHGLAVDTWMFVPAADPVRVVRMRLANTSGRARRISVHSCARLVLGGLPQETAADVVTRADAETGALFATNPRRGEFSARVAFAAAVAPPESDVSWTADRTAFLGPYGSPEAPAALRRSARLDGAAGAGLDPCAAFQVAVALAPGATVEVAFLLGEGAGEGEARALVRRYASAGAVVAALADAAAEWRELVSAIEVETPSAELDLMVNGWLTYQNLGCRIRGRSAFSQSGGAFGFRDQLQDSSSLVYLRPELTRAQILLHAAHQFVEGDVLHWWHPPLSKGIRTRFADDLLWLPYLTAFYVDATGDAAILDEEVRFVTARALEPGEDEAFVFPEDAGTSASLHEHCCRAIDRSLTRGAHGLPLIGTGDWNDGMNRVGREGRGESVWLGFFLHGILDDFIPRCEARDDAARAAAYRAYRAELAAALNDGGWDGGWYRRAYYDDGAPLGSAAGDECRIDAIAQAWAVLSRVAPAERARRALDAMEAHLVSEPEGIIRLLTPAFDRTPHDPGYIKGYLPGVRENGGQYTHAALWAVRALAEAGRTERAARLLEMVSPVSHGRTAAEVEVYRAEPYVVAADVYGVAPHVGRGGWTWYTGSASWMFRVALESVLGITLSGGDTLVVRPCVPAAWPGFTVRYRLPDGRTTYEVVVTRADGGEIAGTMDGVPVPAAGGALRVPLRSDGAAHRVDVVLGRDAAPVYAPRVADAG